MITYVDILNKNGAPERMANNEPQHFEVECLINYSIDPGQRGIFFAAPEDCCPEYPPEVTDINLASATILYGSQSYDLCESSRWWSIIEDQMNEDEMLKVEIFEYEEHEQDGEW